ncbi:MAG: hypothetical protein LBQ66_03585 [Planctomycetaceae bacterium]|nr:hypothetical protein [Planctomycetaceae bacterium]
MVHQSALRFGRFGFADACSAPLFSACSARRKRNRPAVGYPPYDPVGYPPYDPVDYSPYDPVGYSPYDPVGYSPYGHRRGFVFYEC